MATVLLLEDNEHDQRLFGDLLSSAGHEVLAVGHVFDAIRLIRQLTPHLVITGLQQPEFSGLDFVRWLRLRQEYRALPIVVVSAMCHPHEPAVLDCGAHHVMQKPISGASLLRTAAALLSLHSHRPRQHDRSGGTSKAIILLANERPALDWVWGAWQRAGIAPVLATSLDAAAVAIRNHPVECVYVDPALTLPARSEEEPSLGRRPVLPRSIGGVPLLKSWYPRLKEQPNHLQHCLESNPALVEGPARRFLHWHPAAIEATSVWSESSRTARPPVGRTVG